MVTRVLSLLRGSDAGAARTIDPALDLNAYALADEIELTLVLKDHGVELALRDAASRAVEIAGVPVPVTMPTTDLQGLIASGARVVAVSEDLAARGLAADDLLEGIDVVAESHLAELLIDNDVTLSTAS